MGIFASKVIERTPYELFEEEHGNAIIEAAERMYYETQNYWLFCEFLLDYMVSHPSLVNPSGLPMRSNFSNPVENYVNTARGLWLHQQGIFK